MLGEVGGFFVVALQLVVVVFFILLILQMNRLAKNLKKTMRDAGEAMNVLPEMVAPLQWNPLSVGVVASLFQIKPKEVLVEYRKEDNAKRGIVQNTFPESKLTKRFLDSFNSRFLSVGYDFRTHGTLAGSSISMPSKLKDPQKTDVKKSAERKK